MSSVRWNRRQWLFAGAGTLALAGVLFGAGFATAQATEDPDDGDGNQVAAPISNVPNTGRDIATSGSVAPGYSNAPATDTDGDSAIPVKTGAATDEAFARGGGASQMYYPGPGMPQYGYCAAELPAIVSGSTIDVSGAIALNLLGDGFTMRSITVRGEGECDDEGQAIDPYTVVDSSWVHGETGFEAYVTQRPADEQQPNVLTPYNGQVWAGGYVYTVWVNAYPIYPLDDPARSSVPNPEEAGEPVIRAALAQLAPSVEERCYYVQTAGSWEDLAALGIGDPRPAIPADLVEQYSDFQVFAAPPADCDAVELTGAGSFNASFGESIDGGGSTYVSLGAWAVGPGNYQGYGFIDEGSAYWTNDRFSFNVSAYGPSGPIGRETIEAIARAMDPDFSSACFISTRQLQESDLAGLGFGTPAVPDGFEIVNSYLNATEAPDCGSDLPDAAYYPQYNLNWSLKGPDGIQIEAAAYRYPESGGGDFQGYIYENGLNWMSDDGSQYSVYGYDTDGDGTGAVDRETLIAVALGLDPSLDVDSLQEGPDAVPYAEKPMR